MSEVRQEVACLNGDVLKLRQEFAYVGNSVRQTMRVRNGVNAPPGVASAHLDVWDWRVLISD